jgi:hypothetical protein
MTLACAAPSGGPNGANCRDPLRRKREPRRRPAILRTRRYVDPNTLRGEALPISRATPLPSGRDGANLASVRMVEGMPTQAAVADARRRRR